MMIKIILLVGFIFFSECLPAEILEKNNKNTNNKKVLLVGIDGLQFQYLQKLATPNINRLFIKKAYTGGIVNQQTEQATSSGPAWATIMTGVWANKHRITSNNSGLANAQFPSLYRRIYEHNPSANMYGFATWEQTHSRYFQNDLALLTEESHGANDIENFSKALSVIQQKPADFIFLHLDDVDHAGHAYCFGPEYEQAIIQADSRVGNLLDALETRQTVDEFKNEDWLVLLVTDHGRDQLGCGHGEPTEQEKTVFIASNKQFASLSSELTTGVNNDFNGIYHYLPQTTVAPTILRYLNIDIKDEWLLEGYSLFEDFSLGVISERKSEGQSSNELRWPVNKNLQLTGKNIEIWRNGILLTKIPYKKGHWRDLHLEEKFNDYQFKINGQSLAYRIEKLTLIERANKKWDDFISVLLKFFEWIFSPFIRYVS